MPSSRVALVTGSSSGFGLLACVELARRGFRVFASMRDLARADRLDRACAEAGVACDKVRLDVTDPASIAEAVDRLSGVGDLEVLVNNAGFGLAGFVEDLTMDELREQFETNFFGLVAVTKAVLPGMRARRRGRIINVSSIAGQVAHPAFGAYSASKFAVEGLSESLRHELLPHGVFVTLIEPGMFRTDIFERNRRVAAAALDPASPNYRAAKRIEAIALRRIERNKADPRRVALAIAEAATAARPPLRVMVGADARAAALIRRITPFRLWETAVRRVAGARAPEPELAATGPGTADDSTPPRCAQR